MTRKGFMERNTGETKVKVTVALDGSGQFTGGSGIGFFDHQLEIFARHSGCDLNIEASGDTHVDYHHLVEDIGIVMGRVIRDALGNKAGINRYGSFYAPMDEALIRSVVDFSGRSYLAFRVDGLKERVGDFDTELVEEFLRAFVGNSGINLHIDKLAGTNTHHIIEAIFKALARSLKIAWTIGKENSGQIPSTKGLLD